MKNKIINCGICLAGIFIMAGCQKMERPALGNYPVDKYDPTGPLRFYTAFDITDADPLQQAKDSVFENTPLDNPLAQVDGVSGKGIQGSDGHAIKYPSANLFSTATSCTIALWVNNTVNPNTELYFSLVDKDYWHASSAFLLVEHAKIDACTFKFALMDHWVEYTNQSFTKPLFNGQWHHMAFVYDETTSKLSIYFDGVEVPTPGTSGNFTKDGAPLGKLNLKNGSNLVIGGWNKHAGLDGPTDDWIKSYSGKMDQFRLYARALSASEVLALYNSKQ
ncbi:MAG: LamG domain-containing protein [Ferruginibacter sp.]